MEQQQMPMSDLDELPPHLQTDPHVLHWRMRRVERRVDQLAEHHSQLKVRTPMGELSLPVALLLLLVLLAYRPDLALKFIGL